MKERKLERGKGGRRGKRQDQASLSSWRKNGMLRRSLGLVVPSLLRHSEFNTEYFKYIFLFFEPESYFLEDEHL